MPPLDEPHTDEDAALLGHKVLEMVDHLRPVARILPGSHTRWHFTVDDVRYSMLIEIADR